MEQSKTVVDHPEPPDNAGMLEAVVFMVEEGEMDQARAYQLLTQFITQLRTSQSEATLEKIPESIRPNIESYLIQFHNSLKHFISSSESLLNWLESRDDNELESALNIAEAAQKLWDEAWKSHLLEQVAFNQTLDDLIQGP